MTQRPAPLGSSVFARARRAIGSLFSQAPSTRIAAQLPVVTSLLVTIAMVAAVGSGLIYRAQLNLVRHTYEVQRDLAQMLLAIQDVQLDQRRYLVSGDEARLAQAKLTQAEVEGSLTILAGLTSDSPVQQASLAALRTLEDKATAIVDETIRLRRAGHIDDALLLASRDGEVAEAALRARVVEMELHETGLLQNRIALAAQTSDLLLATIGATILLAALALMFWLRDRTTSAGARDRALVSSDKVARNLKTSRDETAIEIAGREGAEGQVRQMQKMEAVGQLTGGIAHDFNNMLAVIMSAISLSRRRLAAGSSDIGPFLDAAMDAASRAASLTARLLAFSRQQPLRPETLDAAKFVAGMADLLRRTLGETVELQTVGAGALWRAHVDASQLENAILNLAVNARDAMPDGAS